MSLTAPSGPRVAGLFAGIGGIELGLAKAGHAAEFLCESWDPARAVLSHHFAETPLAGDIREVRSLPSVEIVTAGFPCTDLSQAGRTAGIRGRQSGLVSEVFRLIRRRHPTWLVLENVRNLLHLDRGRGMRHLVTELEAMKYRWAYRLVDTRFTGLPQRRQRVLLVASRTEDPRGVLLVENAGAREDSRYRQDAVGFYWTEGVRGLGWAPDAVPTLKGGSTIGIPSSPGVWLPGAEPGFRLVTPSIDDAERLQGFARGWTEPSGSARRNGARWKLVGNAVTTTVAWWLGRQLAAPRPYHEAEDTRVRTGESWPNAAWGESGRVWKSDVSMWPERRPYRHLADFLDVAAALPLSHRAAAGFLGRLERGRLRLFPEEFRLDVKEHVELTRSWSKRPDSRTP